MSEIAMRQFSTEQLEAARAATPPMSEISQRPAQDDYLVPGVPSEIWGISGAGGNGKSLTAVNLACNISRGCATYFDAALDGMPVGTAIRAAHTVLYLSGEGNPEHKLGRDIAAAGGKDKNAQLYVVALAALDDPSLDGPEIEAMIAARRPELIILDPIQYFLPASSEQTKRGDVVRIYRVMRQLWMQAYGVKSILIVSNTNKEARNASTVDKTAGSKQITDGMRHSYYMGPTGNPEDKDEVFLGPNKSNMLEEFPALILRKDRKAQVVAYVGTSDASAEELEAKGNPGCVVTPSRPNKRAAAENAILCRIQELGGEAPRKELAAYAQEVAGCSAATVDKAFPSLAAAGRIELPGSGNGDGLVRYLGGGGS